MDILKAPPPRPPSSASDIIATLVGSSVENFGGGGGDGGIRGGGGGLGSISSEEILGAGSDIIKPLSNTVKDALDYFFLNNGSPDSYLSGVDVSNLINDSVIYNSTFNSSLESINGTRAPSDEDVGDLIIMAVLSIVLGLMILITVIGNVFVIAAIILERNLQNVANYLVASLAVADLFVACLVMPLGAVYQISQGWILGPELCDIWTSCDVLCCTASILHLVAIATDRYWAVTNVDYMHSRTSRRVFTMIFLVWFAAVIVSLAPQFGWKDPEYLQRILEQKCMVSQDVSYQVFATCCTFYVPLLVILVLYWKIYQTARKRIHRRRPKPVITANNNQTVPPKSKSRLRFRLASKFTSQGRSAVSSLGLVEGNSTNTVNTVEDTEESTNEHKKGNGNSGGSASGGGCTIVGLTTGGGVGGNGGIVVGSNNGLEVTTVFNNDETLAESSLETEQIATVSHQVSEKQQPAITGGGDQQQQQQHNPPITLGHQLQQQNQISSSQVSTPVPSTHQPHPANVPTMSTTQSQVNKRKETLEAKRERKAAKTLAIITGAFVICWLPFFIMALLLPLCESCEINDSIAALFLWLGYFNSTLNPVIYTIFSPEFRQAFKRILFGAHRSNNYYRGSRF